MGTLEGLGTRRGTTAARRNLAIGAACIVLFVAATVLVANGAVARRSSDPIGSNPLTGGCAAIAVGASPACTHGATVHGTIDPTATPPATLGPTVVATEAATASPTLAPTVAPTPPAGIPTPQPTVVAISNPSVTSRTRGGTTPDGLVTWTAVEPKVAAVTAGAGTRIDAAIDAVIDGRVAALAASRRGFGPVTLAARSALQAYAVSPSDPAAGFVSVQIDYAIDGRYEASRPQYVDVLNFDLRTGQRIGIDALFSDPTAALTRLSAWTATDPTIARFTDDDPSITPTGYEPTPANFAMWSPTPNGLRITFATYQIMPGAWGHQYEIVPWEKVRDLVKPDSYLAWYLASVR